MLYAVRLGLRGAAVGSGAGSSHCDRPILRHGGKAEPDFSAVWGRERPKEPRWNWTKKDRRHCRSAGRDADANGAACRGGRLQRNSMAVWKGDNLYL